MELWMWHLFKLFFVVYLIQVLYFLWSHWSEDTVFPSRQPRRYRSVLSKQRHTFLEKIVYSFIQLFSRQWNHYNIVSLREEEPATPQREGGVLEIDVTEKTKYLLVGYHSRSTLDLVYLVMNLECNIFVIHILFYLPLIKHILPLFGLLPAKDTSYQSRFQSNDDFFLSKVLESDRPVLLLPGGAMECMKDFEEVFQLRWRKEMGFARIIRNYYLSKEKAGEEKVRIKIIPFYTRYGESLFYTSESWYTSSGRTVRQLMQRFQENYLANISLLPVILLAILFSFGFFLLPLPLPLTTVLGREIDFDPASDVSTEAFTQRIKEGVEVLISEVHREEVAGRPLEEPLRVGEGHRPALPSPSSLPSYDELLFKHSLLYSPYETTWLEKIYLFALGFFGIVGNIFLQLIGVSSLCLTYLLLLLLTPVFRLCSASILKKMRKQKIS